jgi:hypothetical protein
MYQTRVLVVIALFTGTSITEEPDLYRFGRLGRALQDHEVSQIVAVVTKDYTEPWALLGWYSQVLPSVWHVDLFLPPTLKNARLRRGPVSHVQCTPPEGQEVCGHWQLMPSDVSYGQVAEGASGFGATLSVGSSLERPFRIYGDFSDDEVLSLVEYIRSSPRPEVVVDPQGRPWHGLSVTGSDPIISIGRKEGGLAWVRVSPEWSDGESGQEGTVIRSGQSWRLVRTTSWIY